MIEQLQNIGTLDDITNFGLLLLQEGSEQQLIEELKNQNFLCLEEDKWFEDTLNDRLLRALLTSAHSEESNISTLHLLQVVQRYCPAVSHIIERVLSKFAC